MDERRHLLILVARDEASMTELITGMLDAGVDPETVVESRGLGAVLQRDTPIFAGLAGLLPQHTGDRMIFAITTTERLTLLKAFVAEMLPQHRPLGLVLPIEETFGAGDET